MASSVGSRLMQTGSCESLTDQIRFVWRTRRVWWFAAMARTRARFVRTKLGSMWLGLTNLLTIAALAMVYGTVFKVPDFKAYAVYLGMGLVLWNSLSAAISGAPGLFEKSRDNINNINLNPVFYVMEEWAFQLQTFFQSFVMVMIGLSFFQASLFPNFLQFGLPGLLNFLVFLLWLPLIICLVGARFKDLYQLVPVVLQLVFLLSPVLYTKQSLGAMGWVTDLNPLYISFGPLRSAIIDGKFDIHANLVLLLVNIIGIVVSLKLLQKERRVLPFLV
ncbi:MAG: ABC transporter permease [Cyanobacteriota bacterium]|jgi:lipopolysaccharide transport system permease protein